MALKCKFVEDVHDMNVYETIGDYKGNVLILSDTPSDPRRENSIIHLIIHLIVHPDNSIFWSGNLCHDITGIWSTFFQKM